MKIKLDENLPLRLTVFLASLNHDVYTVADENLSGGSDRDVWEAAQRAIRDHAGLGLLRPAKIAPGTHYGILLVRFRSPDRQSLFRRIRELFQHEEVRSWIGCFVVATGRKVRLVRPPG